MKTFTAFIYYFSAIGTGVAMINQNIYYSMLLGGIALISLLVFNLTEK
jgi:hypothetical protein